MVSEWCVDWRDAWHPIVAETLVDLDAAHEGELVVRVGGREYAVEQVRRGAELDSVMRSVYGGDAE